MQGVRVRPSPKLKSYMLQSQKIKKKKTTKLLQDREDKQSLKKQKRGKKEAAATQLWQTWLCMEVCVSLQTCSGQVMKMPSRSKGTWAPEKRSSPRGPLRRQRNPGGGTEDTAWEKACQRRELPGDKDEEQRWGYRGQGGRKADTVSWAGP